MTSGWDRGHWLALAAIVVAVVFGVPVWLQYIRDGKDETPAAAAASSSTHTTTTTVPERPVASASVPTPEPSLPRFKTHTFPGRYLGVIWIRIGGDDEHGSVDVSLSWGAKHSGETIDLNSGPMYLTSTKNGTDATPLGVTLDRPAEITFGTGDPPSSASAMSIDGSWRS